MGVSGEREARNRRLRAPLGRAVLAAGVAWGSAAAAAGAPPIGIELNKLEAQPKGCRAYVVIDNPSDTALQVLKLDLVFFRTDGTIDRRLALDVAPIRPAKKSVKTFDLDALPCETLGSVLVNDVIDCRDAAGPVADCLDRLKLSSRAAVPLGK